MAVVKSPKNVGKKQNWIKLKKLSHSKKLSSNHRQNNKMLNHKVNKFHWAKLNYNKSNLLISANILYNFTT